MTMNPRNGSVFNGDIYCVACHTTHTVVRASVKTTPKARRIVQAVCPIHATPIRKLLSPGTPSLL